ncbi:hypothetical protein [Polynucleobacter sp.]|uniref:hypothetical protein n=1 Tax=Polynucleobacter sp. TaxID=2029855 RepID=UPI003F698BE9
MNNKSSVVVIDNIPKEVQHSALAMARGLEDMVKDIILLSVMRVPHDTGALQRSAKPRRDGPFKYGITYGEEPNVPYARRWEFETPPGGFKQGRQSKYLRSSAHDVTAMAPAYFMRHTHK